MSAEPVVQTPARRRQPRGLRLLACLGLVVTTACGGEGVSRRAAVVPDVPEPAVAGATTGPVPGTVVSLRGEPEGLALDAWTGVLAVAVRKPGGVVLVDAATGTERARIPLGGAARHLALAGPGGPVLVPSENDDKLYRVSLPDGTTVTEAPVGRQPHDVAAAAGGVVVVGDELADSIHVFTPGGPVKVVPAPVQPGGVAASADGSIVVVVGVRGRRIEAFSTDGRSLGSAPCGVGPTHVRAGADNLFYVADTQGGAVLVFSAGADGVRQVGEVSTGGGAPYGLAVDGARRRLYVTLTERNELRSYSIDGAKLVADRTWATVRQPNDVEVDPSSGRVIVAGTAEGQLQLLDPLR
jgi:DNA-binding beta-propeller fold protein YncE